MLFWFLFIGGDFVWVGVGCYLGDGCNFVVGGGVWVLIWFWYLSYWVIFVLVVRCWWVFGVFFWWLLFRGRWRCWCFGFVFFLFGVFICFFFFCFCCFFFFFFVFFFCFFFFGFFCFFLSFYFVFMLCIFLDLFIKQSRFAFLYIFCNYVFIKNYNRNT